MVFEFLIPIFWLIVLVVGVGMFKKFGRVMPVIPLLNPWPIKAIIWEVRNNGTFPKILPARNGWNRDGDEIFEVKNSEIETVPKKFTDAVKGIDGFTYIFLVQPSKTTALSVHPKITLENESEGGVEYIDRDGNVQISKTKTVKAYLANVLQEEKTLTWRKHALERSVVKSIREPTGLVKNMPLITSLIMIGAVLLFFILAAEPFTELTTNAERVGAQTVELIKIHRDVTEDLKNITIILSGGSL